MRSLEVRSGLIAVSGLDVLRSLEVRSGVIAVSGLDVLRSLEVRGDEDRKKALHCFRYLRWHSFDAFLITESFVHFCRLALSLCQRPAPSLPAWPDDAHW